MRRLSLDLWIALLTVTGPIMVAGVDHLAADSVTCSRQHHDYSTEGNLASKVEFSRQDARGDFDEEEPIYRSPDNGCVAPSGRRCPRPGALPGAGHQQRQLLQMAGKIWGMDASMMSQMKALEDENRRLKRMHADLSMQPIF